jgi:DNA-binding transcriptional ArsR family regulator
MFLMNALTGTLTALSHPARRAMLDRLARGPARVTEIAEPFDMSLNAVSKHLKVLEAAGLISREVIGREHVIAFRAEPMREVATWVREYERFWTGHLDGLEAHFKDKRRTRK